MFSMVDRYLDLQNTPCVSSGSIFDPRAKEPSSTSFVVYQTTGCHPLTYPEGSYGTKSVARQSNKPVLC